VPGVAADSPSAHLDLEPLPNAARVARSFLADNAEGLDPEDAHAAAVCASELVTNGVLHARTPIVFGVTRGADFLLVTVADQGTGRPEPPPPDHTRPSGRGLVLVAALADDWGIDESDEGKTVWFTVARNCA
jgi:anti-sigma regulatory factor (Ser/Thr protein kinase)